MRIRRRFLVSATIVATMAVALTALAPSASASKAVPFQRGVTLGEWGESAYEPQATEQKLRGLKRKYGARWVTLFVVWMQADANSTDIHPGFLTANKQRLVHAMRYARRIGLRVILRPYVDREDGGWRGELQPSDPVAWFASYRQYILTEARLAQRYRAKGFVMGSELKSLATLSTYNDDFRGLIGAVRKRFKGFVTYQANWDEYQGVDWWGDLDAIDISAYFPLTFDTTYSVADLIAGWHNYGSYRWFDEIKALHEKLGLPVFFGELGYRTVAGGAVRPWDTTLQGAYSPAAQKIGYKAAFRVWFKVPWFKGFDWWYLPTSGPTVQNLPAGRHVPARPSVRVMKRWYHKRR